MASAVFADGQRTRSPTLQQGRVRMVQTRTNPGDSPCHYPCVQQFMFCYLAKVETHEESAFILRKFTASSKCPNVRNTHVDVRSPYVDIWSADFYIAPACLRACVCWPASPLPTTCLWYDMTYTISGICFHPIRTTTGFKKSYCRSSLRLLPIPTYIRSADFYQAGVLIRACACADQHACPSQNQSSAADLKKNLNKHWIFNCDPRFYVPKDKLKKTKKQITLFRVPVLYSNTFFDIRKKEVLCSMNSE